MYTCSRCTSNTALREAWGCNGATRRQPILSEDDNGQRIEYWMCPANMLLGSVRSFDILYHYHTELNAALPPVDKVAARFLEAIRYFQSKLHEYIKDKQREG